MSSIWRAYLILPFSVGSVQQQDNYMWLKFFSKALLFQSIKTDLLLDPLSHKQLNVNGRMEYNKDCQPFQDSNSTWSLYAFSQGKFQSHSDKSDKNMQQTKANRPCLGHFWKGKTKISCMSLQYNDIKLNYWITISKSGSMYHTIYRNTVSEFELHLPKTYVQSESPNV